MVRGDEHPHSCPGKRGEDFFDREICWCGSMHYRCTECGGVVDGHSK